ncbi:dephospho-CoA kinase [Prevotella nigrescens]
MKVAITGGIGSGKSFVCERLHKFGIAVYDCDEAAKRLIRTSNDIQERLSDLVGAKVFVRGKLQKAVLASFLLHDKASAQAVNDIVHPAVAADFEHSGYDFIESAILFDSGFINRVSIDKVICVTAPIEVRVQRIVYRDQITPAKAQEWINRQLPQSEMLKLSNYEIVNDGQRNLDSQIQAIIDDMAKLSK